MYLLRGLLYGMRQKQKVILILLLCLLFIVLLLLIVEMTQLREYTPVKTLKTHLKSVFKPLPEYFDKKTKFLKIDEETLYQVLAREQINLAGYFWYDQVKKQENTMRYNETCALLPDLLDLKFANVNWQVLTLQNSSFQLHSAYLDNRDGNPLGSVVRILGVVALEKGTDDKLEFPDVHCQIWSETSEQPLMTQVFAVDYLWREYWGKPKKGTYHPYMLTCVLPDGYPHVPAAVSLVGKACDKATNLLKVTYNNHQGDVLKTDEPKICVCVKGISEIEDKSLQLIEWSEWLKLVGVQHVYVTVYYVHENMQKVLDYYAQKGFLTESKMTLPGNDPNSPYLQHLFHLSSRYNYQFDLIAFNDCLLRNMYNFDFVIPLELDEIPMAKYKSTLQEMLKNMPKDRDAYSLQRVPYIQELVSNQNSQESSRFPDYLTFLKSVYRLKAKENQITSIKCLYNTRTMVMIHNHYPFMTLGDKIVTHDIPSYLGYVEQHLENCPESKIECKERQLLDARKWDFKDKIVLNVGQVMRDLGFF